MKKRTLVLSTICSSLILVGCGSSSDNASVPNVSAATARSTTVEGVITGFGSVFVNGVEYETDFTDVETDDNLTANEGDLEVGMVVTVNGTVNADGTTGDAIKIHYSESLKGVLESIDLVASSLTLLGQTVLFDDLTSLKNLTLDTLIPGDFLEISGFENAEGDLYATRIEKEDAIAELKLKGEVIALDTQAKTFMLGKLTINYANAERDDFDDSVLTDGQRVKVKGAVEQLVDNVFSVVKIKLLERRDHASLESDEDDHYQLEGFIDSWQSTNSFTVRGQRIVTNSETEIEHGTIQALVLNARVKLKGKFDDAGNLVADEIRIHQQTRLKLHGVIESIDQNAGTVTLLGTEFQVNQHTKLEDDSETDIRFFSLKDLSIGDLLVVKGFIDNEGQHVATKLKRKQAKGGDETDETELKGEATALTDTGFTVMGIVVETNASTRFEAPNGDDVEQSMFFERLQTGMLVKVEGVMENGVLQASEVEVKGEQHDDTGHKRTEFKGLLEEVLTDSLIVSGHKVVLLEDTEFKSGDEQVLLDEFLSLISVGDQLKVKGTVQDNQGILAREVSYSSFLENTTQ